MYVITAHQRHGRTDGQTDVKRSHDRYIAKACSGKKAYRRVAENQPALLRSHALNLPVTFVAYFR